jgi:hypothetical protein
MARSAASLVSIQATLFCEPVGYMKLIYCPAA